MTDATSTESQTPELALERVLTVEIANEGRKWTFDIDDKVEAPVLAPLPHLKAALDFLKTTLDDPYTAADESAQRHQKQHRRLATWAIFAGSGAVALAIIQLGLGRLLEIWHITGWSWLPAALEIIAVVAGYIAVRTGRKAKHDDNWFVERHRAERLRMLKFRSLGSRILWCDSLEEWQKWVNGQKAEIEKITSLKQVEDSLSHDEQAEPVEDSASLCIQSPSEIRALAIYYRWKRVEFQANYFERQSQKFSKLSERWQGWGLKLFFGSIIAVFIHVAFDFMVKIPALHGAHDFLHAGAITSLTIAALLPVVNLCIRAWQGAFEHSRSAALFDAKHHALKKSSMDVDKTKDNLNDTMHHIAHIEHFLSNEHREWLRLMLETEWFL